MFSTYRTEPNPEQNRVHEGSGLNPDQVPAVWLSCLEKLLSSWISSLTEGFLSFFTFSATFPFPELWYRNRISSDPTLRSDLHFLFEPFDDPWFRRTVQWILITLTRFMHWRVKGSSSWSNIWSSEKLRLLWWKDGGRRIWRSRSVLSSWD